MKLPAEVESFFKNIEEVYIHIGFHKTGSTFLQCNIFPVLGMNFSDRPRLAKVFLKKEKCTPEVILQEIYNKTIFVPGSKQLIVSHEVLSGDIEDENKLDKFFIADTLYRIFPNASIVLVIRKQTDYLESLYNFRVVKRGYEHRSLIKFLENNFEPRLKKKLFYTDIINYYQRLFGKEKVCTLLFEELKYDPKSFVLRALNFLNNKTDLKKFDYQPVNAVARNAPLIKVHLILNTAARFFISPFKNLGILSEKTYGKILFKYLLFKKNKTVKKLISSVSAHFSAHQSEKEIDYLKKIQSVYDESNRLLEDQQDLELTRFGYFHSEALIHDSLSELQSH